MGKKEHLTFEKGHLIIEKGHLIFGGGCIRTPRTPSDTPLHYVGLQEVFL